MPYDPRPTSKGGNRGIDELFSREAPKRKFRIIGVDTFDGTDWYDKDLSSLKKAKEYVEEKTRGKKMLKYYVYNSKGECVHQAGSY
jgi:hypothetical protein